MDVNTGNNRNVVVTDIKMPFGSMVIFLVKLALASIPALLIIWAVMFAFVAILMLLFGGMEIFSDLFRQFSSY
ncbi:conserved hypothetical protein [Chlorobaculum parvum NCIB 8327]|uniref:Uncharacterized protein n=1 Tax=Chlorobaculum parvum (strain DSM 263 / NCIMB 8327) TaxID=517417 RepID=B3QMP4_CHLP8|nr:hypothetical protein [Chlorobaculum parvum]ACF11197.1 conserved hypothetical protein [Chlorobaculum parvum NCIB 8327]